MTARQRIVFKPHKGARREGQLWGRSKKDSVQIWLDGDPFPVTVKKSQVSSCNPEGNTVKSRQVQVGPTKQHTKGRPNMAPKTSAKALRQKAEELGIDGWEGMDRAELTKAIKAAEGSDEKPRRKRKASGTAKAASKTKTRPRKAPAKAAEAPAKATRKRTTKKATAAKKAAPTRENIKKDEAKVTGPPAGVPAATEVENPFRKGSQLHVIFPMLVKGGKRRTLAERLQKKVDLHPYKNADASDVGDYDKRVVLAAQALRDRFGYAVEQKGRGLDGSIKVVLPSAASNGAKGSRKKAAAR